MPTENKAAPFHREDRYNVIKYTDLERLPHAERRAVNGFLRRIHESVLKAGAPARQSVVIESDWPEYEPAWQMIERRMAGQPPVTAAEELDAVLHWRTKHSQAIKERDALQQRLTAADEREDTAIAFVTRLIECAGGQPSVATGYLRDILDVLKPAEPASDEHVCSGCGSKGWTANCKECVPY